MSRSGQEAGRTSSGSFATRVGDARSRPRLSTVKSFSQLYNEIVNPGRERHSKQEFKRQACRLLTRSAAPPPARQSLRKSYKKSKSESKLKEDHANLGRRSKSNHQLLRDTPWIHHSQPASCDFVRKAEVVRYESQQKLVQLREELHKAINSLDHTRHLHLHAGQCFLDYQSFWEVFLAIGYAAVQNEGAVRNLWQAVGGEEYGGMMVGNMSILLEALAGVRVPSDKHIDTDRYYLSTDMKLIITPELLRKLEEDYSCLRGGNRHNRSKSTEKGNHVRSQKDHDETKPSIFKPFSTSVSNGDFIAKLIREHQLKKTLSPKVADSKRSSLQIKKRQPSDKENHTNNSKSRISLPAQPTTSKPSSPKKAAKLNAYRQPPNELFNLLALQQQQPVKQAPLRNTFSKKVPLLSVDVNLGEGQKQKIIVYEGETARLVALALAAKHNLSQEMRLRFETTLQNHIAGLLTRIDQLPQQTSELE